MYTRFPSLKNNHDDLYLKYIVYIIYTELGDERAADCLKDLNKPEYSKHILVLKANLFHIYSCLDNQNFDEAEQYIDIIKPLYPKIASKLLTSLETQKNANNNEDTGKDQEVTEDDKEEEIAFDPISEHKYYQAKKAALAKRTEDTPQHLPASWQIKDDLAYQYSADTEKDAIKDFRGIVRKIAGEENTYCVISEKIGLMDTDLQEINNALKNGIIFRQKGKNGIKLLQKKLYELKINADLRLWTTEIFENNNGEILLVFAHKKNDHEAVLRGLEGCKKLTKTFVNSVKITSEEASSPTETLPPESKPLLFDNNDENIEQFPRYKIDPDAIDTLGNKAMTDTNND